MAREHRVTRETGSHGSTGSCTGATGSRTVAPDHGIHIHMKTLKMTLLLLCLSISIQPVYAREALILWKIASKWQHVISGFMSVSHWILLLEMYSFFPYFSTWILSVKVRFPHQATFLSQYLVICNIDTNLTTSYYYVQSFQRITDVHQLTTL